ncbi:MAG: polysaccharide pyruvyl transferase CsaB [Oscillospiraceae bacterium]|jgi:polysaccharide pyruvyl transferase CsaB|nr:polysaccharide pyruvyl transferase CsaB [Oscillospiraceae bacterium]
MKVLHLISGGDVGGAKTHVLSLLKGLSARMDVRLVVFREGPFAEEARALGGFAVDVLPDRPGAAVDKLEALLAAEGADIVHSHGSRGNMVAGLLRRRRPVPTVTTVHSDYRLDYLGRPLARVTYGNINKWALRRLDYHIGVSQGMTDLLCDRGFSPDRLFTLYNGLDFTKIPAPVDRAAFWAPYGFSPTPDDVVCGIAARLSPVKDIDTLLRGFAAAAAHCPRLRLVVAGHGELYDRLRALADTLGLAGRVCFAGWMTDMEAFYQAIDVNLLTSLTETFPYALLEGARARRATVATAVGGVPALIDHMVSGYLFRPGDAGALAGHLRRLCDDPALRTRMGEELYRKAVRTFSMEVMLDTQEEIYRVILRRAARPPARREGVLVCGAYGYNNAGDDAILEGIVREIRAVDPDRPVTVLSRSPRQTRRTCGVSSVYTFNPWGFWRAARRAALFISGGGSLIQNVTSNRSLWYYLLVIVWARRLGARVLMYGCGVGPLTGRMSRRLTARVLDRHVEAITLREESSLADIGRLGVTRPRVVLSADPALNLPAAARERVDSLLLSQGVPPDGDYIAFALRRWPGFEGKAAAFAEAADYVRDAYGLVPVFLPIERRGDIEAAALAAARVKGAHHLLSHTGPAGEVIGILGRCRAVVAMRLHALIFASGQGIPLVGVAYDEKVTAFLTYMGQSWYTPFASVDAARLKALIDGALAESGQAEARLAAVARLRAVEGRNMEILQEMLREAPCQK